MHFKDLFLALHDPCRLLISVRQPVDLNDKLRIQNYVEKLKRTQGTIKARSWEKEEGGRKYI